LAAPGPAHGGMEHDMLLPQGQAVALGVHHDVKFSVFLLRQHPPQPPVLFFEPGPFPLQGINLRAELIG